MKQQANLHTSPTRRRINLALQGGGSHGAFTWGVLDALLEDERIEIEGISGTSAGAMNAVLMADGYSRAGSAGARESLRAFWHDIASVTSSGLDFWGFFNSPWGEEACRLSPIGYWMDWVNRHFSPYQTNPFGINPLRDTLQANIDFARVRSCNQPKVFVAATRVRTGKVEIFSGERLTLDALMASACLPTLYQAVETEGDYFWDGGFGGNPALNPLIYRCDSRDILLVQINPIQRNKVPTMTQDITDRMNEIGFNASLIAEMRTIDFVDRMLREHRLDAKRYRPLFLHRIDGMEALTQFSAASKHNTQRSFLDLLCELGRKAAKQWLTNHFAELGRRGTIDIERDYLDGLRVGSYKGGLNNYA